MAKNVPYLFLFVYEANGANGTLSHEYQIITSPYLENLACSKLCIYCQRKDNSMQKNRLRTTVSIKQTLNEIEFGWLSFPPRSNHDPDMQSHSSYITNEVSH